MSDEHTTFHDMPELRRPLVVAAFSGWSDAGEAASSALRFMTRRWRLDPFAEIEAEEFYDFTQARPRVRLEKGERVLDWPANKFSAHRREAMVADVSPALTDANEFARDIDLPADVDWLANDPHPGRASAWASERPRRRRDRQHQLRQDLWRNEVQTSIEEPIDIDASEDAVYLRIGAQLSAQPIDETPRRLRVMVLRLCGFHADDQCLRPRVLSQQLRHAALIGVILRSQLRPGGSKLHLQPCDQRDERQQRRKPRDAGGSTDDR